jgi:hypothetical protein
MKDSTAETPETPDTVAMNIPPPPFFFLLQWLIDQRTGPIKVATEGRDDVTIVTVPRSCVGFITGHRGANLRDIEVRRESIQVFKHSNKHNWCVGGLTFILRKLRIEHLHRHAE